MGRLPPSMRASFSWVTFEQLTERAGAALIAETFNARPDRHLSWTPILLDQIGWKHMIEKSDIVFRTVLEEQGNSERRLAAAKQAGFLATAAIAVFESPTWLWQHERSAESALSARPPRWPFRRDQRLLVLSNVR